jgi:hypothetical protein
VRPCALHIPGIQITWLLLAVLWTCRHPSSSAPNLPHNLNNLTGSAIYPSICNGYISGGGAGVWELGLAWKSNNRKTLGQNWRQNVQLSVTFRVTRKSPAVIFHSVLRGHIITRKVRSSSQQRNFSDSEWFSSCAFCTIKRPRGGEHS